ncbi:glycosyltransferase family 2 protein [uncultured Tateyamaria sp.]|uniref:glycosyltransferase n=1 Tax=Tateyamaria sp. 1078 TaxID=3417464 RepID=UPI0026159403|nr:glycosyltransferase family 2 protein [uncultured Tateyamaria sp.]
MKIDICLCTFRRPQVADTIRSIARADVPTGASLRVIVIDNDDTPSAKGVVADVAEETGLNVLYRHVPGANISIARNGGLEAATADWIAFLDDDEIVEPDWLTALVDCAQATDADAVFGHSRANYSPDAPDWIVEGDFHSQFAAPRGEVVETGHTCNALLRWGDAPWRDQRFEIERGRSGGEDTEFFFRLRRMGARYAIADGSIVREDVPPARLTLSWLMRRRYRIGQSYAAVATGGAARIKLFGTAAIKAAYCYIRAVLSWPVMAKRAFWLMRGTMHTGVCAGCLRLRQSVLYGAAVDPTPKEPAK